MPIKAAMALIMNSAVRLPMLIRLEVKQSGSTTILMTNTMNGACKIRLAIVSLSFKIRRRLRCTSTVNWRQNFINFIGCIAYPPPALPRARPPPGG